MLTMKNKKLLVKKIEPIKKDDLVLYTETASHKSFEGRIEIAGSEEYKVGQHVLFSEYAGEEVVVDGEKFHIVAEEDIWCIKGE